MTSNSPNASIRRTVIVPRQPRTVKPAATAMPAGGNPVAQKKTVSPTNTDTNPTAAKTAGAATIAAAQQKAVQAGGSAGTPSVTQKIASISSGVAVVGQRLPLGEMLVVQGVITREQLQEALEIQRDEGGSVGSVLKKIGYCTDGDILLALGRQAGMEVVSLSEIEIPEDIINRVEPTSLAETYRIVPIEFDEDSNTLTVAMADPLNLHALDELRFMLNCNVIGAVAGEEEVTVALAKYYGNKGIAEDFSSIMAELDGLDLNTGEIGDDDSVNSADLEKMANAAPVIKLLNLVLLSGIRDQAADLHFEPYEDSFRIRYKVDGALVELQSPPRSLAVPLVSRIKVMSALNIAERRVPQDGKISLTVGGRGVDLRVSTLPTIFGESVVIRILDKSVVSLDINRLGMPEDVLNGFLELVNKPNGIMLVTGPTGSGKTTTLYACISAVNDTATKIITTEDPVEYEVPGVIQCPIRPEIGVTYAACLRAILRQDPDKILVGEIRDVETAGIAVEAALTGHLVFSTLHTQDSPSTVARLVEMGIESYLLAATVEAIVAQRLIRSICPECKTAYKPSEQEVLELGLTPGEIASKKFYYGKGCGNCKNTGYKGRAAIYEILRMNARLRDLVITSKSTELLRQAAVESGMSTLRRSGIVKAFDGVTSIEEVVAVTLGNED